MEPIDTNPPEKQVEGKYKKDDYTLKEWDRKIEEEDARWRHAGISLDQMNYAGSEHFALQCKVQALINIILEGDMTEENMNLNLKMLRVENMERIREVVEPQIAQAKLMHGVPNPSVILPWMQKGAEGNGG